jgi:hypothetical protein
VKTSSTTSTTRTFDEEEEYERYMLMLGPEERTMAAVGDDTLVLAGMGYRHGMGAVVTPSRLTVRRAHQRR